MADQFNAHEVLTMAVQIERNGQEFYREASRAVDEEQVSTLLSDLAGWEHGHEALFESMRSDLTEEEESSTAIDPYGESEMYLRVMADDHVFRQRTGKPAKEMIAGKSTQEIIDLAIRFEKDSLLFFLGMERLVSPRLGKDRLYKVIDEEIGHISYLERQRSRLKG
jgi:rubrerythrin